MTTKWKHEGTGARGFASVYLQHANRTDIMGRAAELSYYFLLALFPLLMFMLSLLGLLTASGETLRNGLIDSIARFVPASAAQLVNETLQQIMTASKGEKLALGLLGALWAASNGMGAICDTLNIAYEIPETRSWFRRRWIAVKLTIMLSSMILSAMILLLYENKIANRLAEALQLGHGFKIFVQSVEWIILLGFVLVAYELVYFYAPNISKKKFVCGSPGGFLGMTLWMAASYGFRLYLHFFNSFSRTYGSLGAVIILMLWLYFTGISILAGGVLNARLERDEVPLPVMPSAEISPSERQAVIAE